MKENIHKMILDRDVEISKLKDRLLATNMENERLKTDMQSIYDDAQRFLGHDSRCSKEPLHRVVSISKVAEKWAWRKFTLKQTEGGK